MHESLPFGAWLRLRRHALDLTQAELAARVRRAPATIRMLELGARRPSRGLAERLAEELRLDPELRDAFVARARGLPGTPVPGPVQSGTGAGAAAGPPPHVPALPAPMTPLVGRAPEIAEVRALLGRESVRLLTLTGPGGTGKTRLALHVATELRAAGTFTDGVVFIPLDAVRDPALVVATISLAIGGRDGADHGSIESLKATLRGKHVLIVLDNLEHLLAAGPQIAELLAAAGRAKVLVTSRSVLHIMGEQEYPVPPLPLPDPADLATTAALARVDAVRLFVERTRAVDPTFELTDENAAAVAAICARLDGLPLAIELAAARGKLFPPRALLDRLGRRLPLLTSADRDRSRRQSTMRDTLDWSHDLLSPAEQVLFRQLVVFVGGLTVGAAEAVCALPGDDSTAVLAGLGALADHSMIQRVRAAGGERRFRLLETMQEYGLERLAASGEEAPTRGRHADYYAALAETVAPSNLVPADQAWLARLEVEHDNLRAAMAWYGDNLPDAGLRLANHLWPFWRVRGHHAEGRRWLEHLLARSPGATASRARALWGSSVLARDQGDFETARRRIDEALAMSRALDDHGLVGWCLIDLAALVSLLGEHQAALALLEEGLPLTRAAGDRRGEAHNLGLSGRLALFAGDHGRARALLQQSLAILEALGDRWPNGERLRDLGIIALAQGEPERARALLGAALDLAVELGSARQISLVRWQLGNVAWWQGDLEGAAGQYRAGLSLARERSVTYATACNLAGLGPVLLRQGETAGAMATLRESLDLFRRLGHKQGIGAALLGIGLVARSMGDQASAISRLEESLVVRRDLGDRPGMIDCLEALAGAVASERPAWAARLLGVADTLRRDMRAPVPLIERAGREETLREVRSSLGDRAFRVAWASGQGQTLDRIVAEVLGDGVAGTAPGGQPGPVPGARRASSPSAREREVAEQIARGLTNRQIATELSISERTVDRHVSTLLGKLNLASRAQIAVWAAERKWSAVPGGQGESPERG